MLDKRNLTAAAALAAVGSLTALHFAWKDDHADGFSTAPSNANDHLADLITAESNSSVLLIDQDPEQIHRSSLPSAQLFDPATSSVCNNDSVTTKGVEEITVSTPKYEVDDRLIELAASEFQDALSKIRVELQTTAIDIFLNRETNPADYRAVKLEILNDSRGVERPMLVNWDGALGSAKPIPDTEAGRELIRSKIFHDTLFGPDISPIYLKFLGINQEER